jgi:hypothetical protein
LVVKRKVDDPEADFQPVTEPPAGRTWIDGPFKFGRRDGGAITNPGGGAIAEDWCGRVFAHAVSRQKP